MLGPAIKGWARCPAASGLDGPRTRPFSKLNSIMQRQMFDGGCNFCPACPGPSHARRHRTFFFFFGRSAPHCSEFLLIPAFTPYLPSLYKKEEEEEERNKKKKKKKTKSNLTVEGGRRRPLVDDQRTWLAVSRPHHAAGHLQRRQPV